MRNVPNENILKLRELTDKLCETPTDEYKLILTQLKEIIDKGKENIKESNSQQSKIKCYETMCTTITNLLNNVTII